MRIRIDRRFYTQLEKIAENLETAPDKLIYNAIKLIIARDSLNYHMIGRLPI